MSQSGRYTATPDVVGLVAGNNITITENDGVYTINADADNLNLLEGNLIDIVSSGDDRTIGVTGDSSGSTSVGIRGTAIGTSSIAIGSGSVANSLFNISIGGGGVSTNSTSAIAMGEGASADGMFSIAIGGASSVNGGSSVAVGTNAFADGVQSSAFGGASRAMGSDVLAIGVNAGQDQTNTLSSDNIYISNRGVNNESNTMRLGNNQINDTYVSGVYSASTSSNPLSVFAGDDGKLFTQATDYVEGIQAGDNVTVSETGNVYTVNATSPVADIIGGTGIDVNAVSGDYTISVSDYPVDDIQAGDNVTVSELNGVYTVNATSPVADIQAGDNTTVDELGGVYTVNSTSPVADIQAGTNITVDQASGVYTINADGGGSKTFENDLILELASDATLQESDFLQNGTDRLYKIKNWNVIKDTYNLYNATDGSIDFPAIVTFYASFSNVFDNPSLDLNTLYNYCNMGVKLDDLAYETLSVNSRLLLRITGINGVYGSREIKLSSYFNLPSNSLSTDPLANFIVLRMYNFDSGDYPINLKAGATVKIKILTAEDPSLL